eukprot:12893285-Prorocentrum_lima.AAC.1
MSRRSEQRWLHAAPTIWFCGASCPERHAGTFSRGCASSAWAPCGTTSRTCLASHGNSLRSL